MSDDRQDHEPTESRTFEPLLEHLTSAVMILDYSEHVTYLSHQSDPLLAQARVALLGKTLWEVFPEAADSPFYHSYRDALRH